MFLMQMVLLKSTEFLDAQILHPDLANNYQTLKVMLVLQYCIPENIYGSVYLKRDFMDRVLRRESQLTL
jgi:hypothetical protein